MEILNVLYIEDDNVDQKAVQRLLKREELPINLSIAATVQEAEALIALHQFDVVLTDYLLPDGNAFDVIQLNYPAPIIFLTGEGDEEVAVKAMKSGCYDYLIKDRELNYLKILGITIFHAHSAYKNEERLKLLEYSIMNAHDTFAVAKTHPSNAAQSLIIYQNDTFKKLFHHTAAKEAPVLGDICILTAQYFDWKKTTERLAEGKSVSKIIHYTPEEDADKYVDVALVPILNNDSICTHYVLIIRDITDLKVQELKLQKAEQIASDARKSEEHFLGVISHELRTPVNAIVGFTNMLWDTALSQKQQGYLEAVKASANNLLALVNDFLDLSKIERGRIELTKNTFNLGQHLQNCVQIFHLNAQEKNIGLESTIADNLHQMVVGDPVRLSQILFNLVNNAIKFTEKGKVSVDAKMLIYDKEKMVIEMVVRDTGIGISEEGLKNIFLKYEQANARIAANYGGSGIGLYVVKKLIDLQGGMIDVRSKLGEGTEFRVVLTYQTADIPAEQLSLKKKQISSLKGFRVLAAEDDHLNRRILITLLDKWEASADVVENGKKLVDLLAQKDYDIVLLDLQMPIMDGYETVAHIREKLKNDTIPIIIMTAFVTNDRIISIRDKINGCIQKPYEPASLFELILNYVSFTPENLHTMSNNQTLLLAEEKSYNLDYLRTISKNNQEFINEMIVIFIEQTDELLAILPLFLEEENFKEIGKLAHKYASTSRSIGNHNMSVLCRTIEKAIIVDQVTDAVPGLVEQLQEMATITKEELREELSQSA